jgi:hypothetical protein
MELFVATVVPREADVSSSVQALKSASPVRVGLFFSASKPAASSERNLS